MSPSLRSVKAELSDPELRSYLARYLRRRVPAADADDALQAVYCAALEARNLPDDAVELRRWMTVVARRKVAAFYARTSAEQLGDPPEQQVPPAPVEAHSLLRWAEQQAAESQAEHADETLEWMARESDGEKLEAIAAEVSLPSTSVRQRVFRLRRFMKARWALELSAALLAVLIAALGWALWSRRGEQMAKPTIAPTPSASIAPRIEEPELPALDPPAPIAPAPSVIAPPTPSVIAPPKATVVAPPKYTTPGPSKPGPTKAAPTKKGTATKGTPF